jgi:transcriptional regulator with XRE-family HTH domain
MDGKHLRMWRKTLGMSQKDAAEALGLKLRILQYYEKGERDGKPIKAPKAVRLACWAIAQGRSDFSNDDIKLLKDKSQRKKDAQSRPLLSDV